MTGDGLRFALRGGELAAEAALRELSTGVAACDASPGGARERVRSEVADQPRAPGACRLSARGRRRGAGREAVERSGPAARSSRGRCQPRPSMRSPEVIISVASLIAVLRDDARGADPFASSMSGCSAGAGQSSRRRRVPRARIGLSADVCGDDRRRRRRPGLLRAAHASAAVSCLSPPKLLKALGDLDARRTVELPRARAARVLRSCRAGPYAWIRHPNYLAVFGEIAGFALIVGAPWISGVISLLAVWDTRAETNRRRGEPPSVWRIPNRESRIPSEIYLAATRMKKLLIACGLLLVDRCAAACAGTRTGADATFDAARKALNLGQYDQVATVRRNLDRPSRDRSARAHRHRPRPLCRGGKAADRARAAAARAATPRSSSDACSCISANAPKGRARSSG